MTAEAIPAAAIHNGSFGLQVQGHLQYENLGQPVLAQQSGEDGANKAPSGAYGNGQQVGYID